MLSSCCVLGGLAICDVTVETTQLTSLAANHNLIFKAPISVNPIVTVSLAYEQRRSFNHWTFGVSPVRY
jgi:hypothetical protein